MLGMFEAVNVPVPPLAKLVGVGHRNQHRLVFKIYFWGAMEMSSSPLSVRRIMGLELNYFLLVMPPKVDVGSLIQSSLYLTGDKG